MESNAKAAMRKKNEVLIVNNMTVFYFNSAPKDISNVILYDGLCKQNKTITHLTHNHSKTIKLLFGVFIL